MKMTPLIAPSLSLIKSLNSALFTALAGLNYFGISKLLPLVAVNIMDISNRESLKDPS